MAQSQQQQSQNKEKKKERNFPQLQLNETNHDSITSTTAPSQQVLVQIQSPKTPTLSRKLKAVSLDSDPPSSSTATLGVVNRDVFSMPNTPKKQLRSKFDNEESASKVSNLKKFASNTSISGSQTLKTLPEIMTLQDFSHENREPVRVKAKGLLERRGSNASLTIDLGSNSNIADKNIPLMRLNSAKSVSNLNLTSFGGGDKCMCGGFDKVDKWRKLQEVSERRKSQETCLNCTIYESIPHKTPNCPQIHYQNPPLKCHKCRRKSLSNENLYVPPCNFCLTSQSSSSNPPKECGKNCKGYRRAHYPRQPDLESSQLLSEDFKLHLQNVQYLQTAGSVLSIADLKAVCQMDRVPKLHLEFWEVPLNLQEKCYVSGSQSRNRYRGVLPNEHSRVHLPGAQGYIHANYIKGPDYTETAYIATQGPMAHTCEDFWEMVWHTNSTCIVMLTELIEKGRSKCELYFPLGKKTQSPENSYFRINSTKIRDKFTFERISSPPNSCEIEEETIEFEELDQVTYGCYTIKYLNEENLEECTIRHLELSKNEENSWDARIIHHYWFPNWQDHKMANPEQLLKIALHVLNSTNANDNNDISKNSTKLANNDLKRKKSIDSTKPPIIVHCSAGIGRTGCFLAILNGIQQLKINHNVDILAILCSLRLNRGGMVQTAEQYELIHRVLSLYADTM